MHKVALTLLAAIVLAGCAKTPVAPQYLCADPVASIRVALPSGWSVLKVEEGAYPFYRPPASGRAIYLVRSASAGTKPDFDAVVYIMPADYADDGQDPVLVTAPQTNPPHLMATAANAKVYLWTNGSTPPSLEDDLRKVLFK
jgi:hypothetical protein